jgi:outer membrane biosynthesis protein TonB
MLGASQLRGEPMNATSTRCGVACGLSLLMLMATLAGSAEQPAQDSTSGPRLRDSVLPAYPPRTIAGGEVVLELIVDAAGGVTDAQPLRVTTPFTDALVSATKSWVFEPSIRLVEGDLVVAPGRVLVAAVFRPPTLYNGATPGTPPRTADLPSVHVPDLLGLTSPVYPVTALGDGMVLVEIEMTALAAPVEYRVLTATPGFEEAALDAVRNWRFGAPREAAAPDRIFSYALLAFRAPVAPGRPPG